MQGWCEGEDRLATYYNPPEYATPMWEIESIHVSYYNDQTDEEVEFDIPIDQNSQEVNNFLSVLEKHMDVEVILEAPEREFEYPDDF